MLPMASQWVFRLHLQWPPSRGPTMRHVPHGSHTTLVMLLSARAIRDHEARARADLLKESELIERLRTGDDDA